MDKSNTKAQIMNPNSGFKCPTCGKPGMVTMKGECKLSNGLEIPDMEWDECLSCGEKMFDGPNSDKIINFKSPVKRPKWKGSSLAKQ